MLRPYLILAAIAYFVLSLIGLRAHAEDEIIADFPEPIVKERPRVQKVKPSKEMWAKGYPEHASKGKVPEPKEAK